MKRPTLAAAALLFAVAGLAGADVLSREKPARLARDERDALERRAQADAKRARKAAKRAQRGGA
jgi:hypothetical protein